MDLTTLRKRILFYCATSPLTLLPIAGAATVFLVQWAGDMISPVGILATIALMLGGVGMFCTQLLLRRDVIAAHVLKTMQQEQMSEREKQLDDLRERLVGDGDKRTERYLADLRSLMSSFQAQQTWQESLDQATAHNIRDSVEELFEGCVRTLERTLELAAAAKALGMSKPKKPLLEQRERLINGVEESISKFGQVLGDLSELGLGSEKSPDISHIQSELDARLEVARDVDRRVNAFRQTGKFELE